MYRKLIAQDVLQKSFNIIEKQYPTYTTGQLIDPPNTIDIHVSNSCNLKCKYCPGIQNPKGRLPQVINPENIVKVLGNITSFKRNGKQVNEFHFAGDHSEPLTRIKTLVRAVEFLQKEGRESVLYTNGVFLDHKELQPILPYFKYINVSLDACSRENFLFLKLRDEYDRVLANINRAVNNKYGDVQLNVSFVAQDENINKLYGMFVGLEQIGVSKLSLKTDMHGPSAEVKERIGEIVAKAKSSLETDILYAEESDKYEETACWAQVLWPAIAEDAMLYRCAHAVFKGLNMGGENVDLLKYSLQEIFDSLFSFSGMFRENYEVGCKKTCARTTKKYNNIISIKNKKIFFVSGLRESVIDDSNKFKKTIIFNDPSGVEKLIKKSAFFGVPFISSGLMAEPIIAPLDTYR